MVELGKTIFFGGIGLIFIIFVGMLVLGAVGWLLTVLFRDVGSAEEVSDGVVQFIKSTLKLFNPVAQFHYLKHTRESGDDRAGCFAVMLLIPFYGIMLTIIISLVRTCIIYLLG